VLSIQSSNLRIGLCSSVLAAAAVFATTINAGWHSRAFSLEEFTGSSQTRLSEAPSVGGSGGNVQYTPSAISIDYPETGSIFPPEITPPTFLWRDPSSATTWQIDVSFSDGAEGIHVRSIGARLQIGPIDSECISATNKLPTLNEQQAADHTWTPDVPQWDSIKRHSVAHAVTVVIRGIDDETTFRYLSEGFINLSTSEDPVGAPIFYRDVPLMPAAGEKGIVQPLAQSALHLINWRLREISKPESRVVMHDLHTCANCHSFSADGKWMGIDVDGPGNDKGLYATVPVKSEMSIRNEDMISWNSDLRVGQARVGFMSQISPDGQYVLSTFAGVGQTIPSTYFVKNFTDYRFLQVFYPTRGILAVYSRATGRREPLSGADDPRFVQTDGVWSPDGKYIVFARAKAIDPAPEGATPAKFANDPNEPRIRYDLYCVPFNHGRGGQAEPIAGASNNGMSNNFPKISPDGRWIVFVRCHNGQLMRPDSQLYIVSSNGGEARRMRCNTRLMNSWHSFSPNGRWMVFSSKSRSPYTGMFLTHIDIHGNDSPAIFVDNSTAANRAVNLPEFVNIKADGLKNIDVPASDFYRVVDDAMELQKKGDLRGSLVKWKKALELEPGDARANNGMGSALYALGDIDSSITYYRNSIQINPRFFEAYFNLGLSQIRKGDLDGAIDAWSNVVRVRPSYAPGHENLGYAYYLKGRFADSLEQLHESLRSSPDQPSALNLAASLMATCPVSTVRNGKQALELAERADQLSQHRNAIIVDTLSSAFAELGQFEEAIKAEHQAIALATEQKNTELVKALEVHLARYSERAPLREPPDPIAF
jgi:tetratricopeptide (TPR) repeat protein